MENWYTAIKWKMRGFTRLTRSKNRETKTDYRTKGWGRKQELQCLAEGMGIVFLFSYFFYRSFAAVLLLSPMLWFYRKQKMEKTRKNRIRQLEQQFRECLISIQTNLQAGYSIENAFRESYSYIVSIFGSEADMAKELAWIQKGLTNGDTLEHLLWDMGSRCPDSALEEFADIYSIACRTGGGWTQVIAKLSGSIRQRMELKQEIETLIHGKKLESKIMCVIPFFILFYMDITSKGYFDVLYHNPVGIVLMSLCLAAYILAFFMAEKMTEI